MIGQEEETDPLMASMNYFPYFVPEYLEKKFGGVRLYYDMEFVLDMHELQEYADGDRRHLLTTEELKVVCAGMTQDQMKKIFDESVKDLQYNRWVDACQWILEELERDYEAAMKELNQELVLVVVNGPDRGYPDYSDPEWKVINEKRLEVTFGQINLSDYEGRIVGVKGYLTYVQNPPVERVHKAEWKCRKCGGIEVSDWQSPEYCNTCEANTSWIMDDSTIEKEKIQEALLTEEYEASSCGFQISLSVMLAGENTGKFAPGDHVAVLGKVMGNLVKNKGKEPYYAYMIEVSQIRREERHISISDEDRKGIDEFSRNESNVLDSLSELYAPGIIGQKEVKKAIILQAAGSDENIRGGRRVRGNIHILLVGDPGTGKSQLLMAASQICPKALYVSDASAAGMTAAVDEVNGKRVMVAGVMVLADGGIAAIDEIEKMNKDDRKAIHPAMEQGEIHKSKAGLHASFKSRTSVLAAANPLYGRFVESDPIPQQIDLEPSLLDRFDLIFIFKERQGTERYEKHRALAILEGEGEKDSGDFLLKYIMHSKSVHPSIPRDITAKIAEYFASLKCNPDHREHFLNARTLESLQRLTLASARIRMSEIAGEEDLENAKELLEMYLKQFNFDMDAISGVTGTVRDCIKFLKNLISPDSSMAEHEVLEQCRPYGFSVSNVKTALDELMRRGDLYSPRDGIYRGVSR
jgi:replicative DNA helicase Mcm